MTSNPFNNHQIHECCGNDELRPQWMYIYFHNGFAFATDASILIAISLSDLYADERMINFLNGRKIHKDDFKLLYKPYYISLEEPFKIRLSEERGTVIQLSEIDYEAHKGFSMILQVLEAFQAEFNSKIIPIESIKLNLRFVEQLYKLIDELAVVRFTFLPNKNALYMEFDLFKKSYGVLMLIKDEDKEITAIK